MLSIEGLDARRTISSIKRNCFKTPMHSSIIRIFGKNVLRQWYEKKRSSLLPKTGEMLLFIHHNGMKID